MTLFGFLKKVYKTVSQPREERKKRKENLKKWKEHARQVQIKEEEMKSFLKLIRLIIRDKASIAFQQYKESSPALQETPFLFYVLKNIQQLSCDKFEEYVQVGGDIHAKDENGNTLIHCLANIDVKLFSTRSEFKKILMFLTRRGVDAKACNNDGNTALHIGMAKNYTLYTDIFSKLGLDINAQNKAGQTPPMYAIRRSRYKPSFLIEYLAKHVKEALNWDLKDNARKDLGYYINEYGEGWGTYPDLRIHYWKCRPESLKGKGEFLYQVRPDFYQPPVSSQPRAGRKDDRQRVKH